MNSTMFSAFQAGSISVALVAAGGCAALSLFDIPELQSQPASRSLPSLRWLFSRGSHIFPSACFISSAGFAILAYSALPPQGQIVAQLLNGGAFRGYLAAATLSFSMGPFTSIMVPTNFALIEKNEKKGGARSEASARDVGDRNERGSAEDSVNGKGQASQWTDFSNPQTKTQSDTTEAEDKEVQELLGKFGRLNLVRAILLGAGGVVGLLTALTT